MGELRRGQSKYTINLQYIGVLGDFPLTSGRNVGTLCVSCKTALQFCHTVVVQKPYKCAIQQPYDCRMEAIRLPYVCHTKAVQKPYSCHMSHTKAIR